ncbi:MAG: glycosyltransferase family 4 protein [Myxococcota bacterium]
MRVLALTKYDRKAASTRQRFELYQPGLAEMGIDMRLAPLLSDAYLEERFRTGQQPLFEILRGYARRLWDLTRAQRFDLLFVHSELFPFFPAFGETLMRRVGIPMVVDIDDAIFHQYESQSHPLGRFLLGDKMKQVFQAATAVTAGSRYLQEYAGQFVERAALIPTVVDTTRLRPRAGSKSGAVVVGWMGSPSTAASLSLVDSALTELASSHQIRFVAVGSGPLSLSTPAEVRSWHEAREEEDLRSFDIGIMPLQDTAWNRGKCAFKLIQYMAVGVPTVCSPVGANVDVVTPETGLSASTSEEWRRALGTLAGSPELRSRMGSAGRRRVVSHFSLSSQLSRLAEVLEDAARTH